MTSKNGVNRQRCRLSVPNSRRMTGFSTITFFRWINVVDRRKRKLLMHTEPRKGQFHLKGRTHVKQQSTEHVNFS